MSTEYTKWSDVKAKAHELDPRTVAERAEGAAIARARREAYLRGYQLAELLRLAADHDPGFDAGIFTDALLAVERFAPAAFAPYGLSPEEADALTERITRYAKQVRDSL